MKSINLVELKKELDDHLKKQVVSGKVLLDRFDMIDESSRKSPSYCDPNYAGFYYHLGKKLNPKSLLEFGFDLGLFPACFLISCKSVNRFYGFRIDDGNYFSNRIGARNVKKSYKGEAKYHYGKIYDRSFDEYLIKNWDMVIFACEDKYDKQMEYFEYVWPHVNENGIIICENISRHEPTKQAFDAFSYSKNREPVFFGTRHGTYLLQK